MSSTAPDNCTRQKVEIGGENYYIVVGETFVMATVPRENMPAMSKTREIVENICGAITAVMENRADKIMEMNDDKENR